MPFLRSHSPAASTSPPFSCRAFLQSIMPAPEAARSAFTAAADTATLGAASAAGAASSFLGSSFCQQQAVNR